MKPKREAKIDATFAGRIVALVKNYYARGKQEEFRQNACIISNLLGGMGFLDEQNEISETAMMKASHFILDDDKHHYERLKFLKLKRPTEDPNLIFPLAIKSELNGIANAIRRKAGINRFIFHGAPGTGKTEAVGMLARTLKRKLLAVKIPLLIDSHLGQSPKNVVALFEEIALLPKGGKHIILLDEIDALAMNRVNARDLREMGRVTSTLLSMLDEFAGDDAIVATTNLYGLLDGALTRRFHRAVNFNEYGKLDIRAIALAQTLAEAERLKVKIGSEGQTAAALGRVIDGLPQPPSPGELKNEITAALAFSDPEGAGD